MKNFALKKFGFSKGPSKKVYKWPVGPRTNRCAAVIQRAWRRSLVYPKQNRAARKIVKMFRRRSFKMRGSAWIKSVAFKQKAAQWNYDRSNAKFLKKYT